MCVCFISGFVCQPLISLTYPIDFILSYTEPPLKVFTGLYYPTIFLALLPQDKEKHWEQELNRLKSIHESRLRAGAQKVHKLEQLLMMQTFQLRQDKKRLQEDINRLHSEFTQAKEHAEHQKTEICHLKLGEKDLKEQNADLMDEIQMLRRVVSDLKERLEESEWSLCQRNGEVALMKSQLKDAQVGGNSAMPG